MKIYLSLFLILFSIASRANSGLGFYSPQIKTYVIGENHLKNNAPMHLEIINYVRSKTELKEVILEIPVEVGNIFNKYVLSEIKKEKVTGLTSLLNKTVERNVLTLLDSLKSFNLSKPNNSKIKIRGIDLLNFDSFDRQLVSLSIIYPELIRRDLTRKYIFNQRNKKISKHKSLDLLEILKKDLTDNEADYSLILENRLNSYREQLNQILMEITADWKEYDLLRENFMRKELRQIVDTNGVRILICGAAHALYKKQDDWFYGFPYTSFGSSLKEVYKEKVFTIILQYNERKRIRLFSEFNLLDNPIRFYFKDNEKAKFIVIPTEEVKKNQAAGERCDLVILMNRECYHSSLLTK